MMQAIYQLNDLSLQQIDRLPQSVEKIRVAPFVVLARDVEGVDYTLTCASLSAAAFEFPTLFSVGKAKYLEVRTAALLQYRNHQPLAVRPGIYRVERKSEYVYRQHGQDVAHYALLMGRAVGFDDDHLKELEFASLMHDIGLTGLEDTLWKAEWFTDDDWAVVKKHPARGAKVMDKVIGTAPYATARARDYVLHHHEHMDGSGYHGLVGENIPLGARIIFIADAFHAMISWRPFREPLPEHVAMDRLFADAGYRYDSELLDVFAEVQLNEFAGVQLRGIDEIFQ